MRILLVGIGGYGANYAKELLARAEEKAVRVEGIVDPYAERAPDAQAFHALGVPFYARMEDFYAAHGAELAVISTPIPLHEPQAAYAMQAGSDVLVEKPVAATVAQADRMIEARERTGRRLAVGYQWCYNPAMLAFKRDVDAGLFGKPLLLRAIVLWPRDLAYYARGTGWAGKRYDASGRPIFDSVASNATAHYLMNMLWVAGRGYEGARAEAMRSLVRRVNPIETFDTCLLRAKLEGGAEMRFAASHAAGRAYTVGPTFEYRFERGTARYDRQQGVLTATLSDGSTREYGELFSAGSEMIKLWTSVEAIRGGAEIPCPVEAARAHTRVVERLLDERPTRVFPMDRIRREDNLFWVPGLSEAARAFYDGGELPERDPLFA